MSKKALLSCGLMSAVGICVFLSFYTKNYLTYVRNDSALLSPTTNPAGHAFNGSHEPIKGSNISVSITVKTLPMVSTTSPSTITAKSNLSIEYQEKLRKIGLESTKLHKFKSTYIIDPIVYDKAAIHKVPGKRKEKLISCFNCPSWFTGRTDILSGQNRNFRTCPYSECHFDAGGKNHSKADLVLFFPIPRGPPFRPAGQIWTYCSWEAPFNYGYPPHYSKWKDVFNWTMSYRRDADIVAPYNHFAWRARETLMSDSEYLNIAKSKTKTAAWFVSHCSTPSKRQEYVRRMKKIIDIDIFGRCSHIKCDKGEACLKRLNSTYKFYLSFENAFCKDYVTEKLFRNFERRMQIIPVARGGFDYHKHIPPNTIVDASQFDSPEALAKYLKELGDDPQRYAAMLKEKDKLTATDFSFDWCGMCERLHKGLGPKMIKDIKKLTHYKGVCWPPKL